jgi:hypothetical protein
VTVFEDTPVAWPTTSSSELGVHPLKLILKRFWKGGRGGEGVVRDLLEFPDISNDRENTWSRGFVGVRICGRVAWEVYHGVISIIVLPGFLDVGDDHDVVGFGVHDVVKGADAEDIPGPDSFGPKPEGLVEVEVAVLERISTLNGELCVKQIRAVNALSTERDTSIRAVLEEFPVVIVDISGAKSLE